MANVNKPFGLAPHRSLSASKFNEAGTRYYIPSTDTLAYYIGDTVLSAAAGDVKGATGVIKASLGTETLRGVIVGFEPASQGVSLAGTALSLDVTNCPATKTRDYYAYVIDDPFVMYTCQGDLTATNQTAAKSSSNTSLTVAAPTPAAPSIMPSATVINSSTIATTSSLSIKLMGLQQIPNNTYGAFGVYRVKINLHEFLGATAGV